MAKIDELLALMTERGASDLHLASGSAPYLRVNGQMVKLNYKDVTPEVCQALILEILTERQRAHFMEDWDLDCSYSLRSVGRFRVNAFRQRKGVGAVFRLIPDHIQTVEELGLPEHLVNLLDVSEGLLLVTGPTGSGKSTTLAALINHLNTTQRAHIITIEDPIEFVHKNEQCLINQREVASHTKSFHKALRAALREDPDVILVGELRDLESISLALTAAETGHLVLATLHTNSATKTVDRIIDVFPEAQQGQIRAMLSESLRGVVAQTLVRRSDGNGRIPVVEVLVNVPAVANLIREGKTYQIHSTMQTGQSLGMITFEGSVQELVRHGVISRQEGQSLLTRRGIAKSNVLRRA
ncbi:MAG TPA: type IV pilus twitching motility protein PilT [Pyrinomonadaceae bacterium]|jgi:twitching motility protein PilT|nr:type IV pilus twitching motility protein PilT [Pyrinomonadaceae bacterium]